MDGQSGWTVDANNKYLHLQLGHLADTTSARPYNKIARIRCYTKLSTIFYNTNMTLGGYSRE